ncbi:MAG: cyclic nucleotide-binding domain-containing protein, partial [Gammaproteobacteria bacterium]
GEVGNELFVLLSGVAEVFGQTGETRRSIAVLGKGDVFGEIAFLSESPRSAEVRAVTDLELLVLTQESMQRAMARMPEISARILFNLSLTLCERLRDSTRNWLSQMGDQ